MNSSDDFSPEKALEMYQEFHKESWRPSLKAKIERLKQEGAHPRYIEKLQKKLDD